MRQTAAAAVLDGHWGFGQVVMNQAVEMGLERAGNCGVAAITVKNSNHIGRLGSYVERVAEANMIGLLCANSHGGGASVAPWGGIAGRLGTNPLAGGWPDGEGGALVLDITTSVVAEGKVRVKRNRGEPVPEGWIIDAAGQPSTDPADFYDEPRGSLLPFGGVMGHKGYGLGVVVELLGGALSGAGCARGRKARIGNGCFLLVIDIGRFQPARRVRGPSAGVCSLSAGLAQGRGRRGHPVARRARKARATAAPGRRGCRRRNLAANPRLRSPGRCRPTNRLAQGALFNESI